MALKEKKYSKNAGFLKVLRDFLELLMKYFYSLSEFWEERSSLRKRCRCFL